MRTLFAFLITAGTPISSCGGGSGGSNPPPAPSGYCGDGTCGSGETTSTCAADCGTAAPYCGDGACDADEGEGCTSCPTDCDTTAPVCGNGACDAGESPSTCEADCGPAVWPQEWEDDEDELFDRINDLRAVGVVCPDGTSYGPTGPLQWNESAAEAARLHSWDLSYEDYFAHVSCNGRTPYQRVLSAGSDGFATENLAGGFATPESALNGWINSDTGHCNALFTTAPMAGVGIADAHDGFTIYTFVGVR